MEYMAVHNIPAADEEGDCKESPVYSVILVSYQSLCAPKRDTPECIWYKWFTMTEPQELHALDGDQIKKFEKVCRMIEKKSLTYPPIILSGFSGNDAEKQDLERNLRMWGIPDNWTIYLDINDKNKRLEGLEFNINYFIRTFWQNNMHHWIPNEHYDSIDRLTDEINAEARQKQLMTLM